MAHIIPVGAENISMENLPRSMQTAIKSILTKRGEARDVQEMWWNEAIQSYYILIDTAIDEPSATHSVSLQSVQAISGRH